ncbi:MAG: CAP domain-containing protein, partial [Caldilineaceae bacterium]
MADPLLGANPTGARGWLHRLLDEAIRLPHRRSAWLPALTLFPIPLAPARVVAVSHREAVQSHMRRRAAARAALTILVITSLLLPTLVLAQEPAVVTGAEAPTTDGPFAADLAATDLIPLDQLQAAAQVSASATVAPDFVPEQVDAAFAPAPLALPQAQPIFNGTFSAEMMTREVALVYYLNVYRRQAGVPPLRWNREMSDASRWFANDAVMTKPACSHTDSLGRGPGTRLRAFGYRDPIKWSEVIACGFTEPAAVVQAWVSSPAQAALLLDPALREAGPGYYYSVERQRGYVVLKVSGDKSFAPMVINDENPKTATPEVTLTIHNQAHSPVEMKVSNTGLFADVAWEPFKLEKLWTLAPGIGWKTVFVLTRDRVGRTTLLSDQIYLGASLPMEQLTLDGSANIGTAFAISKWPTPPGNAKGVRLSMGWVLDSAPPSFAVYRGLSQVVNNTQAIGGSELLLPGGAREAYARGTMQGIAPDRILTAYYRLKVSDNRGADEVAQLTVRADGRTFGPVVLLANQFKAANTWQEFGVTFAFSSVISLPMADVELLRTGDADVALDAVRFYGQPLPMQSPLLWTAGAGPYRSQGLQARLDTTEGVGEPFDVSFTPVEDVSRYGSSRSTLAAYPGSVQFNVADAGVGLQEAIIVVCPLSCPDRSWQASSSAQWLSLQPLTDGLVVSANPAGMAEGVYDGFVTVV